MIKLFKEKEKIIDKTIYAITLIISGLVLISIISICLFTWPKADDFSSLNQINKLGIFHHVIKNYTGWDGRAINLGVIQAFLIKYFPVEIVNFIWVICFVLTALVSLKIFLYLSKIDLKLKKSDYLIGTAIISSVLWYGFKNHLAETVYWAIGGIYILAFLFAVIWLYLWLEKFSFNLKINRLKTLLFYVFTIYVGALTENLSFAILAYVGVEMIKAILEKDKKRAKKILLIIVLLMVGLLIIALAPGNFVRSTYGQGSFIIDFSVLAYNYLRISISSIRVALPLFILILLSTPLIIIFSIYSSKREFKKKLLVELKFPIIVFLNLFQYLFAAFASILPFIFVPDFVAPRTSIYFMGFIFFWTYFEIVPIILKNTTQTVKNETLRRHNRYYIFITVFLFCIFTIVISHIINLNRIKKEVLKREAIIKTYSNKNANVVTYPIDETNLPFSYTFSDITEDKNNWINLAVAETYKLKSIRTNAKSYYK